MRGTEAWLQCGVSRKAYQFAKEAKPSAIELERAVIERAKAGGSVGEAEEEAGAREDLQA